VAVIAATSAPLIAAGDAIARPSAPSPSTLLPGAATDIAVGGNGSVWVIGVNPVPGGLGIYALTARGWAEVTGGAVRIAVGPDGSPWVVNSAHRIYHRVGAGWVLYPGAASDIGVGANGSVWVVGVSPVPGGFGIYTLTARGWLAVGGGAVAIGVGPDGTPWVVNSTHQIYHRVGAGWAASPGAATDIAVGKNGFTWTIGVNPVPGGDGIYRSTASGWGYIPGGAVRIGVGPDGSPWVVNSTHAIYHLSGSSRLTYPPDMEIQVPPSDISIGTAPGGGPQLQFTHITWDAGAGPFEIDPTYNPNTGTATFQQALYTSPGPGVWTFDHRAPLGVTGVFQGCCDYNFPLTEFTLNTVNADGSPGQVVQTSPKTDYCITADTFVGGVPNNPNTSFIPQSNCSDPTKPLGWSVGWGDQYDQTDAGQPISLNGVADGTYILRGIVDPRHLLTDSNPGDNETDTTLRISGNTVTVLSQRQPNVTLPTVALTSPAAGAAVSGAVTLRATAATKAPAAISSVQYLLDGLPLGGAVKTAPYTLPWTVGTTPIGAHGLSALVTDSNGDMSTAPVVPVTVAAATGPARDQSPPTVTLINPTRGETLSGTVLLAAHAVDNIGMRSVQFLVDGRPLGNPVTSPPYAIRWNTTTAPAGAHMVSARATDTSGHVATASAVAVGVANPAPPMTCFVKQADVAGHGVGTVTTPVFHTAAPGEVLVAFVSSSGPAGQRQTATVSGGGLKWKLVKRQNAQSGDSEAWTATSDHVLVNAAVRSTASIPGYEQLLTVIAMEGVSKIGASTGASARGAMPPVELVTTSATSLVFAVGNDQSPTALHAAITTLPRGWVPLHQWVGQVNGSSYWSQYTNDPTGAAGSVVAVSHALPARSASNLVAVELVNEDDGS
jgi:hypothetical protein